MVILRISAPLNTLTIAPLFFLPNRETVGP